MKALYPYSEAARAAFRLTTGWSRNMGGARQQYLRAPNDERDSTVSMFYKIWHGIHRVMMPV